MNLLRNPLRRTTAIVAGAFLGLAGAVALVSPASAHTADLQGAATCLDKGWKVDWTLNTANTETDGVIKAVTESATGSALTKLAVGQPVPEHTAISETQTFENSVSSVTLTVTVEWNYNEQAEGNEQADRKGGGNYGGGKGHVVKTATKTVSAPTNCPTPAPTPTPTIPVPGDATPILEFDCTTMTFGLDNPADGIEFTVHYETSKGEERTAVIKPGEKKSETFSATPGFTLDLTFSVEGEESETITIPFVQPDGCDDGEGGGLPLTGAAAGSIAGGAGVLLALGAVLFFMARRRRVKFTA